MGCEWLRLKSIRTLDGHDGFQASRHQGCTADSHSAGEFVGLFEQALFDAEGDDLSPFTLSRPADLPLDSSPSGAILGSEFAKRVHNELFVILRRVQSRRGGLALGSCVICLSFHWSRFLYRRFSASVSGRAWMM
jgi:hypothetical protein